MTAIVHDLGLPSFVAVGPSYSFHELAEIVAEAPIAYEEARADMRERRLILGEAWYEHNAELARRAWQMHRPWWL